MNTSTIHPGIRKSEFKEYLGKGISYDQFKQNMEGDLTSNPDPKKQEYIKMNQHRMNRVEKTFGLSESLEKHLSRLSRPVHWLVITEHWCGDGSQTLPVFQKVADASRGKIDLKLVYRDENPELMDAYLTNNTRSIPKLIQLDDHLNVTGIWGPRPSIAQKLVKELKANPSTADTYANELHLWYAKDRNHSLSADIEKLLVRANQFCAECMIG